MRGRASSPAVVSSKGQGQLSQGQWRAGWLCVLCFFWGVGWGRRTFSGRDGNEVVRGGYEGGKVSRIGVHDVKFLKNQ